MWVLDLGFAGLCVGPGPRSTDWTCLLPAMSDLPIELPAVRVASVLEVLGVRGGSLASTHANDRTVAQRRIRDAVALAHRLGCPKVILDPGVARVPGMAEESLEDLGDPGAGWTPESARVQKARRDAVIDAALDAVCRSLFEICRAAPDVEFALTGSRHVFGLGDPAGLGQIFDDLPQLKLSYWHDTAVAARRDELLGTAQGEWLEGFGNRMSGMTLGDAAGGMLYLPPGTGGVDYPLLSSYRRRFGAAAPVVVELDPAVEPGEIPGAHAFLSKYGL